MSDTPRGQTAIPPLKERIARSVFWLVWSRGATQAISIISAIVVARLLDPTDYGLMALAGIWTSIVALIAEMGLGIAIVQFKDLDERELNACFWVVTGVAAGGYLLLFIGAPTLADWFDTPMLVPVLRVLGLNLFLLAARTVPDGLLRKRLEVDKLSRAEIAAVLVSTPIVLSLAFTGAGVWALVAGALIVPLTHGIVSFSYARWWPGLRVGGKRVGVILRYSLSALGAHVSWAVYQQLDALILGKVAGSAVLGFYSMAKLLGTLPVDKVSILLNHLMLPIMAEFQDDRRALQASFLRTVRIGACFAVPACVGMALVADEFVRVVLGQSWLPAVPLLRVLCMYGVAHGVAVLLPPVLFARYRAVFVFRWNTALLAIMPIAFWAGAVSWGAIGVALSMAVIYPMLMVWMVREVLQELHLGWRQLEVALRSIVVATLFMAAAVFLVQWSAPSVDVSGAAVRLGLTVGVGGLVYTCAIYLLDHPLVSELTRVMSWLLRARRPALVTS